MGEKYLDKLVHFWRASQEKRGKNVFLFLVKGFLRHKEATNHSESAQLTTDKIWMLERKETSQHWKPAAQWDASGSKIAHNL